MTTAKAVLFDMDGVLYSYDFGHRLELLENAIGVPAATIEREIFNSGFEDAADRGEMTTDAYIAGIAARLGVDVTLRQWVSARKWAMAPEPAMIDLARDLSTRCDIALLTNNGHMMADAIADLAPELPPLFGERLFVSAAIGMGKEEASTFTAFLPRLGWTPATTLFVDDSPRYIEQADKAGLITHRFDGIDGFKDKLAQVGLL